MTEKLKANSYCMARVGGPLGTDRRCNAEIPVTELYCADCKKRIEEASKK